MVRCAVVTAYSTCGPPAVAVVTPNLDFLNSSCPVPVHYLLIAVIEGGGRDELVEDIPEVFGERVVRNGAEIVGVGEQHLEPSVIAGRSIEKPEGDEEQDGRRKAEAARDELRQT